MISTDRPWKVTHFQDADGARLADGHYSRRTVGSKQFMPPGERFALVTHDKLAVFGWWRPHPPSGLKSMNGLDGWTCSIFRNTGPELSSRLIVAAEAELVTYAETRWSGTEHAPCGPSGLLSYVWDAKIKSANPGYCFKRAGWITHPVKPRSADDKKTLLWKPYDRAGLGVKEARHAA